MKWYLKTAMALIAICGVVLLLPLAIGWLPDLDGHRNVIAQHRHTNGESIRVVQYWNHIDFYSTDFEHVGTNGEVRVLTLDGDDAKSWKVPMEVNWTSRSSKITLGGGRVMTADWANEMVYR